MNVDIIGHFHKYDIPTPSSVGMIGKLSAALSGEDPMPLPEIGDFVRISEELDGDYDKLAEVYNVIWNQNPTLRDVCIMLHPFGGGVKTRRKIDPRSVVILTPLEVLAEAAR